MNNKRLISMLVSAALALPGVAMATNGYFSHGFGTKSKGLAGGGVALPQDAMAAATNPAGMVFVGTEVDLGAAIFDPVRGYQNTAPGTGLPVGGPGGGKVWSSKEWFLIPSFALNYMVNNDNSVGVAVYGNGGMNTTYYTKSTAGNAGTYGSGGTTGVDLMQLFINVNAAHKFGDRTSVGAGVLIAAQRFAARGFGGFAPFSSDSAHLSNNGFSYSYGTGLKLGAQTDVTDRLTLAGSYQTKIHMSKFDEYAGLFAQGGRFDIPASGTIGLAFKVTPRSTLTFDVQKTWFSKVASVGNPMSLLGIGNLGGPTGAGFGWNDVTTYKLGYQWTTSRDWTWRVGYSKNKQPITTDNVLFNVVAPAVVEQHLTFGFTKKMGKSNEFSLAAMYAPNKTIVGGDGALAFAADNHVKIFMHQYEVEASWAWKWK